MPGLSCHVRQIGLGVHVKAEVSLEVNSLAIKPMELCTGLCAASCGHLLEQGPEDRYGNGEGEGVMNEVRT